MQPESPDKAVPPQFQLKSLLALTAGVAIFMASGYWFGPLGYFVALAVASIAALVSRPPAIVRVLAKVYLGSVVVIVIVAWLFSPRIRTSGTDPRSMCRLHLKQLALGLQCYADKYGCFPPAFIADEHGKPMHSWRVLILPFVEQKDLYNLYRFEEPWDGPHNRLLAKWIPPILRCPADGPAWQTLNTSYLAVVGPQTVWTGPEPVPLGDITDGTGNTILLVESVGSNIHWMEPRDLSYDAVLNGANLARGGISSKHPTKVNVVFADGRSDYLHPGISKDMLERLLTKAGGEANPLDE